MGVEGWRGRGVGRGGSGGVRGWKSGGMEGRSGRVEE